MDRLFLSPRREPYLWAPYLWAKRRSAAPLTRPGPRRAWLILLAAPLLGAGCRIGPTATRERSAEARAEDLLLSRDYEAAIAAFQQMLDQSQRPEGRAQAELGMARAYLEMGSPRKALDLLYAARKDCDMGPLHEINERLMGEAAFSNRDYGLARGYLERSLSLSAGEDKTRILAQLYVCSHRCLDAHWADRYFADLPKPLGPAVREIIHEHLDPAPAPPRPPPAAVVRPAPRSVEPPPAELPEGPVKVIPRGNWYARPVRPNVDQMGKISCLTIHHTGGPSFWGRSAEESADEIRKIQKVHQTQNRWADIAYHYIIDRVGRVWQGRPLSFQGAHAHGNANRGNIGVVVLGNYLHQDMTEGQVRSLRRLVGRLCETYGIPSSQIYTHSEIRGGLTDCPGPAISRTVEDIRRSL